MKKYVGNKVEGVKIAYVGGGSRGWAWCLMSDLVTAEDMSGDVYLYDIDHAAAKNNEIIGNKFNSAEGAVSKWNYYACDTLAEALTGADFVIISILPGTFDEMHSDVHTPEKYGIYQSVGDTSGPGGIVRALRTIPMFEVIAEGIRDNCPDAWVINYTNPMTVCTRTLYRVFPKIKAFGCCHEVFGTQTFLTRVLDKLRGIKGVDKSEIRTNVVGVNHFTWITSAYYKDIDLFELYREFCDKYGDTGYNMQADTHWMNSAFYTLERVKMDLFRRYGYIAAAGDRHLAEFCEGSWYLKDPQTVKDWDFALTSVDWRREDLAQKLQKSEDLVSGKLEPKITKSGEDGVKQMRALLGLGGDFVTNVNIPNVGQIPNLPYGAVVETNAVFRNNQVIPVMAGELPAEIYPLISRIVGEQQLIVEAGINKDIEIAFRAFANDPLVNLPLADAKALFREMLENTKKYLTMYDLDKKF